MPSKQTKYSTEMHGGNKDEIEKRSVSFISVIPRLLIGILDLFVTEIQLNMYHWFTATSTFLMAVCMNFVLISNMLNAEFSALL